MVKETYLAMIENSIDSSMFKTFYAQVNGKKSDIMRNGNLSCALYVSAVLKLFDLIKKVHGTVKGTVHDMEKHGWKKVKLPQKGDVIVWEAMQDEQRETHTHIGFALGNAKAISNSSKSRVPKKHHFTFGTLRGQSRRNITATYRKKI